MSTIKNVIVVGAGGNLGPSIVSELESAKKFTISVLSRPTSKASFPSHIKVFKSEYTEDGLAEAFKGQDAVVSVVGGAAIADQTKLVDAAIKAGVKRFLPSEYGCNTQDSKTLAAVPILSGKAEVVKYLKEKESADFTWTTIITGPFFDFGLKVGFLGYNYSTHTATIYDSGDKTFSVTNLHTIGKAVASVLSHPSETANKVLYISSQNVSQNNILAASEKITGKKWTVNHVTSADQQKQGQEKIAKGDFSGFGQLILSATYAEGYPSDFAKDESLANGLLELPTEDLETDIKAAIS